MAGAKRECSVAGFVISFWIIMLLYFILTNEEPHQSSATESDYTHSEDFTSGKSKNVLVQIYKPQKVNVRHHEDVINVCFTSDKNTILGAMAAINSIRLNTLRNIRYHLIVENHIALDVMTWMEGSILKDLDYRVISFDVSYFQGKIKIRGGRNELGKPMNYARFLYPELLGTEVTGRIIHIDDDVIVQGDIADLAHMKFKENQIAAFSEDCKSESINVKRETQLQNRYISYLNFNNEHVKKLHLNRGACSFNTGVFVTDMDAWRMKNISEQLLYWTELNTRENIYGNERGGGGSQPPMMIVFYQKYTPIHPLWHIRNLGSLSESTFSADLIKRARLLHWSGPRKPWTSTAKYQDVWDRYFVPDPRSKYRPVRTMHKRQRS